MIDIDKASPNDVEMDITGPLSFRNNWMLE